MPEQAVSPWLWFGLAVGQILLVLIWLLLSLAFLLWGDRKIWAGVQMRKGPNVVGPFGLFQSFADFLKFVLKEVVIPAGPTRRSSCWRRCSASPWPSSPGRLSRWRPAG